MILVGTSNEQPALQISDGASEPILHALDRGHKELGIRILSFNGDAFCPLIYWRLRYRACRRPFWGFFSFCSSAKPGIIPIIRKCLKDSEKARRCDSHDDCNITAHVPEGADKNPSKRVERRCPSIGADEDTIAYPENLGL